MIPKILSIISIILFSTSCVSNYVVSSNSYAPTKKEHYTSNGYKIPRAGVSYQNTFDIKTIVEGVDFVVEKEEIEINDAEILNIESNDLLSTAKTFLGTPYRYGGTTRRGIDCSSFTQQSFRSIGVELPRVASAQSKEGVRVEKNELQKGDLIFFNTSGRRISHVGIVESIDENGEIFFIHAASSKGVSIASLSNSYWNSKYRFAKRVL